MNYKIIEGNPNTGCSYTIYIDNGDWFCVYNVPNYQANLLSIKELKVYYINKFKKDICCSEQLEN